MSQSAKITSVKIRNLFRSRWPEIKTLWITDKEYLVPSYFNVVKAVARNSVAHLTAVDSLNECEDYSLLLMAAIRRERIENLENIPDDERLNWAFGEVMLTKYRGAPYNHTCNFAITNKGLYFFDSMIENDNWKSSIKHDNVYAIKV